MQKKVLVILFIILLAAVAMSGCSSEPVKTNNEPGLIELSLEEMSGYNGENGKPAYVAVDGVIYDVSNSSAWKIGKHCKFTAGNDLTAAITKESPHGVSFLTRVPAIGKIKPK